MPKNLVVDTFYDVDGNVIEIVSCGGRFCVFINTAYEVAVYEANNIEKCRCFVRALLIAVAEASI